MKLWIVGLVTLIILLAAAVYLGVQRNTNATVSAPQPSQSPSKIPDQGVTTPVGNDAAGMSSLTGSPEAKPDRGFSLPTPIASEVYYPLTNYVSRITNRWYGKKITATDSQGLPCGAPFTGYHVGDDLETTAAEVAADVPVFAIADGTVREAQHVNGYGGLIVIQHKLGNQTVTAYYGHISLAKTTVKTGQTVKAGQQISVLGQGCSAETDNERKHLHFALHKGTNIDVRGYSPTLAELAAWINPKDTLASLRAQEP